MARITKIAIRRGTAAAWTSANPTLASGEPGYETDTAKIKIGDGSTAWNSLAYFTGVSAAVTKNIEVVFDGLGSVLTTGIKTDIRVSFACTITAWTILADVSGAIQIDIWKDTYANYPPDNSDSMPGTGQEPKITASDDQATSSSLGSWTTTSIASGDTLRFNIDSVTTITRCTLILTVTA